VSSDDVHTHEMPKPPDDPWPAGDPALAAFAEDLRIVASGPPPEPRPGLVAVMGRGTPTVVRPQQRRPKMLVKTVLGSLAAKLALGMGVAAASVTAAGAAGVLPDSAQHAVASVVGATTPFVLPDPSTVRAPEDDEAVAPTTSTTVARAGDGPGDDVAGAGDRADDPGAGGGAHTAGVTGDHPENHGACVSAAAHAASGSDSHGKTVSSVARSDCGKPSTTSSTVAPTTSTTAPGNSTTSTTTAGGDRRASSGPGKGGDGKGESSGKGDAGKG
jgi:hypothetical protein